MVPSPTVALILVRLAAGVSAEPLRASPKARGLGLFKAKEELAVPVACAPAPIAITLSPLATAPEPEA